jgi:hypothetical protein
MVPSAAGISPPGTRFRIQLFARVPFLFIAAGGNLQNAASASEQLF